MSKIYRKNASDVYIINLRAGDFILNHDTNFAPVETLTGSNISRMVHSFDYTTTEYVRHEFIVPADIDLNGNVKFTLVWKSRVPPGSAENVVWEVESIAVADGENWDQELVSKGTSISAADTDADEITINIHTIPVTTLGWSAGEAVVNRYSRDANNDLDTLDTRANADDDALLFGVEIKIPLA